MDNIQMAQVEAAEQEVVQRLREKGLLPPDPQAERYRLEQEVVKAAREWRKDWLFTAPLLREAVERLLEFEAEHGEKE